MKECCKPSYRDLLSFLANEESGAASHSSSTNCLSYKKVLAKSDLAKWPKTYYTQIRTQNNCYFVKQTYLGHIGFFRSHAQHTRILLIFIFIL